MTWPITFPAGLMDISITNVSVGDTIAIILHASYPVLSEWQGGVRWYVDSRGPRKVPPHGATFFGGTVTDNDTTTGIITVVGSPSALEGVHQSLKPGAGTSALPVSRAGNSNKSTTRTGTLELPWNFMKQAFLVVDNPEDPGERPTTRTQAHWPKFLRRVRLGR